MATTTAPLFGLDASGSLAKSIVFSKWKGRTYVRRHAIPSNPKSGLQVGMRSMLKFVTQNYASLSATIKGHWATAAKSSNITALNEQVRKCQVNARINKGAIQDPTAVAGTTPNAPASLAITAQPKSLVVTWTHPASNPGNYTAMVWMSKTTGFTPDVSTLVAVVTQATLTIQIPDLVTGTPYYFRVAETNTDGTIGALVAQQTGTPT